MQLGSLLQLLHSALGAALSSTTADGTNVMHTAVWYTLIMNVRCTALVKNAKSVLHQLLHRL
jgi:hypothetical protein